jgi:hypothetical protein
MFTKSFIVLALAAQAFATVFITSPVASTTFSGGKQATVSWQDDGSSPSLKDFGPAKVSIYVGNAQQQTSLQLITGSVDVSTTASIQFTPDPTIGPNSNQYFIRIESLSLKDAKQPQYPALAFSAKFNMDNMSGTFSDAALAQIAGQSTAPLASQSTTVPVSSNTATTKPTSAAASTTSGSSKAASATSSHASASATKSSGALSVKAGWTGAVLGAIVGVAMF